MRDDLERPFDAIRIIAERRIEDAIAEGAFDNLPRRGPIDCSLSGERFFQEWFRKKLAAPEERLG